MSNSWIVVSRDTGVPVLETWSEAVASAINTDKYNVYPALEWLQIFNKHVKETEQ